MGCNSNSLEGWCATSDVMIRIKLTHTIGEYVKPQVWRAEVFFSWGKEFVSLFLFQLCKKLKDSKATLWKANQPNLELKMHFCTSVANVPDSCINSALTGRLGQILPGQLTKGYRIRCCNCRQFLQVKPFYFFSSLCSSKQDCMVKKSKFSSCSLCFSMFKNLIQRNIEKKYTYKRGLFYAFNSSPDLTIFNQVKLSPG